MHYIKPVPPMYVTEYASAYKWPDQLTTPEKNIGTPTSRAWSRLEHSLEDVAQRCPAAFKDLAPSEVLGALHAHRLDDRVEQALVRVAEGAKDQDEPAARARCEAVIKAADSLKATSACSTEQASPSH
jgi:hypothetical protein